MTDLADSRRRAELALEALTDPRYLDRLAGRAPSADSLLDRDLDRALARAWIAFQPIFESSDRSIYGHEALVRTTDPVIATPSALFSLAEKLDRVAEVERVIRARIAEEIADAPEGPRIFVNVHPRSLEADFLYATDGALARFASRVVLEITERSSLHEIEDAEGRIASLRRQGYAIAIDDLGAGYAGLTSFAMLQPDLVKFDMDLVRGIDDSKVKSRVVGSMVHLCHDLGIRTVAEGIETRGELERVIELGCDLLQGFLWGRPARGFRTAPSD